jgi:rubrerythrin
MFTFQKRVSIGTAQGQQMVDKVKCQKCGHSVYTTTNTAHCDNCGANGEVVR